MNKLIIDAAKKNIFLMIISNDIIYSIVMKIVKLIMKINDFNNDFLKLKILKLKIFQYLYVNRGPGSFAGIRNSLSIVKAIHLV